MFRTTFVETNKIHISCQTIFVCFRVLNVPWYKKARIINLFVNFITCYLIEINVTYFNNSLPNCNCWRKSNNKMHPKERYRKVRLFRSLLLCCSIIAVCLNSREYQVTCREIAVSLATIHLSPLNVHWLHAIIIKYLYVPRGNGEGRGTEAIQIATAARST